MVTSAFLWRMTLGNFILGDSEPAKICAEFVRESRKPSESPIKVVPTTGLEPVRCYSLEPESSASANSATWALVVNDSPAGRRLRVPHIVNGPHYAREKPKRKRFPVRIVGRGRDLAETPATIERFSLSGCLLSQLEVFAGLTPREWPGTICRLINL